MIAMTEVSHPRQQRRRSFLESSSVCLIYGIHDLQVDIAGVKVVEAQLAYKEILSVSDDVEAYVNGQRVEKGLMLRGGERLEFVKPHGRKGSGDDDEFYSMTCYEAADLFGVKYHTVREWIITGKLRGTRKPLRTSLQACRELRDKQLVQIPAPVDTGKPRPYSRRDRQPWEFIDPSQSGKK